MTDSTSPVAWMPGAYLINRRPASAFEALCRLRDAGATDEQALARLLEMRVTAEAAGPLPIDRAPTGLERAMGVASRITPHIARHPGVQVHATADLRGYGPKVTVSADVKLSTALERAALLADLARAVGSEVEPPSRYGLASVWVPDWDSTGVTVTATVHVVEGVQ